MADDVATLGIQVESDQVLAATQALAQLTAAANTATQAMLKSANAATSHAAAHGKVGTAAHNTSAEINAMSRVFNALFAQLEEGNSHLGRLGSFMHTFGTEAVLVGGVLGTLVITMEALNHQAEQLGEKALNLKAFSDTTGLTAEQLQALRHAAEELGVAGGTVQTALTRLTANMSALQRAQGPVYEELLRINPQLALEASQAKGAAEVLSLIAKASVDAGDNAAKLAQAIGGRGGVALLPLLREIAAQHGVEGLTEEMHHAITMTNQEVQEMGKLQGQINSLKDINIDLFRQLFAGDVLQKQKTFQEGLNDLLRGLRDAKGLGGVLDAIYNSKFFQRPQIFIPGQGIAGQPGANVSATNPVGQITAQSLGGAESVSKFMIPENELDRQKAGLERLANQWKDYVTVLGGAATADEKLSAKIAELNSPTERAKIAIAALALGIGDATKVIDRMKASLNLDTEISKIGALVGALRPLATVQQQVDLKAAQLNKTQMEFGNLSDDQKNKILALTRAQADGTLAIKAQADAQKIQNDTIGMSVGAATAYRVVQEKILEGRRIGKPLEQDQIDLLTREANALGGVADAGQRAQLALDIKRGRQEAFLSDEDVAIAERLKGIYPEVADALKSTEAAQLRFNDALKASRDIASDFATAFINGMAQGKSATDSLNDALKSVGQTLTSKGVKDLIGGVATGLATGNYVGAAVGGIELGVGFISQLFGGKSARQQQEEQQRQQAAQQAQQAAIQAEQDAVNRAHEFSARIEAASIDTSTFAGRFAALETKAQQDRNAEAAKGNREIGVLEAALAAERTRFLQDELKRVRDILAPDESSAISQRVKTLNDAFNDMSATLSALGQSTQEATDLLTKAMDKLRTSFIDDITARINDATSKGYLNQFSELIKQVSQMMQDAATLGVDTGQVQQYFTAQAQKLVEDNRLVGDSFNNLITTFPELAGRITESTTVLKEMQDAAQKAADAITKSLQSIQDYLNQLQFGGLSTLSPTEQLNAAQQAFAAQLDLAKAGNADALNNITKTADQLLNVAKSFYASGTGYANIYGNVTGSLSALVNTGVGGATAAAGNLAAMLTGGTTSGSLANVATAMTPLSQEYMTTSFTTLAATLNSDARQNFTDLASTIVDVGSKIIEHIDGMNQAFVDASTASADGARVLANRIPIPGTTYSIETRTAV